MVFKMDKNIFVEVLIYSLYNCFTPNQPIFIVKKEAQYQKNVFF